jgi:hypothetical protein
MTTQQFKDYVNKLGKGILYGAKVFLSIEEICQSFGVSEDILRRDFTITKLVNSSGCQGFNVLIKPINE